MLTGFDISDLDLGSQVTKNQIAQIKKLIDKKDFSDATLNVEENTITFAYWNDYDTFITFIKKLVIIKQDIITNLIIEDRLTEEYWTIEINGNKLEECYGRVFWGNSEDKSRIKNVLLTHLEASPEVINEILEEIVSALKGEYDHLEDVKEPTEEELEKMQDEYDNEETQKDYLIK